MEKYARFMGVKIGKNCSIGTRNFGTEPYLIEIGADFGDTRPPISGIPVHFFVV
jgi:hypothetical protein